MKDTSANECDSNDSNAFFFSINSRLNVIVSKLSLFLFYSKMFGNAILSLITLCTFGIRVLAGVKQINIVNGCTSVVTVGVLTNGRSASSPDMTFDLTPHGSQMISEQDSWGGRVWGRQQCSGSQKYSVLWNPGAGNPATLAEFFFKGANGQDFYDISFVDGYNLAMDIQPDNSASAGYTCGTPTCATVPACPSEYAVKDATGQVISCQSSCSKLQTASACCTGANDDPSSCKPDNRSAAVKAACPDAYSFAYDDQTSTFECSAQKYTVTFC